MLPNTTVLQLVFVFETRLFELKAFPDWETWKALTKKSIFDLWSKNTSGTKCPYIDKEDLVQGLRPWKAYPHDGAAGTFLGYLW